MPAHCNCCRDWDPKRTVLCTELVVACLQAAGVLPHKHKMDEEETRDEDGDEHGETEGEQKTHGNDGEDLIPNNVVPTPKGACIVP